MLSQTPQNGWTRTSPPRTRSSARRRHRFHGKAPTHLGTGLMQGGQSLAKGILGGIFGIFTSFFFILGQRY